MTTDEISSLREQLLNLIYTQSNLDTADYPGNIRELLQNRNPASYPFARLLENFIHYDFTEEEAIRHWKEIVSNGEILRSKLGRTIGIHLALVDYFTNTQTLLKSPILIDMKDFRQTEKLAMIDGLTGIFNRRYMDVVLKKEFNRTERYSKKMSLCLLDIDDFKKLNDSKGHQFGDKVLQELALMLQETIREEDIVCRYGGEEFLIILPETDVAGTKILADRLKAEVNARKFFKENKITFSGGCATYPEAADNIEKLLLAADRALYQAKFTGKNRILTADAERRKFGRYEHSPGFDISIKKSSAPVTGIFTQNISRGGIQFKCNERYSINTSLLLVFPEGEGDTTGIETKGRVTWVKKLPKSYIYGVSFIDTPERLETRILNQLHAIR